MEFCAIDSHPQCQFEQCLILEDLLKKIAEKKSFLRIIGLFFQLNRNCDDGLVQKGGIAFFAPC